MKFLYRLLYRIYAHKRYHLLKKKYTPQIYTVDLGGLSCKIFHRPGRNGHTLFFIHGLLDASYGFRRLLSFLHTDFELFLVDIPGFGINSIPRIKYLYQIDVFADLVYQCICRLNLSAITLVGHSMGGLISQHICLQDREKRVKNLVLLSSGGIPHPRRDEMKSILFPQKPAEIFRLLDYLYFCQQPELNFWQQKILLTLWNSYANQMLTENTIEREKEIFFADRARGIQQNTLIMAGQQDEITDLQMLSLIHI